MTLNEVRQKYLDFFEKQGHAIIPSSSLVPENDPTTLFTGSGMQPMVPYLLGESHPKGTRIADSQKSFRSVDIDEVGDNRHTTFFEMLGNWSLGDYWKEEQLRWIYTFLTEELKLPKEKLWVTCFEGDPDLNLPKDTESAEIWKSLGMPEEKIVFYGASENWWSRSGGPEAMPAGEPGGPDSEIFYEFTDIEHDGTYGDNCGPACDCGRFMEIGNSVFMEYQKNADGGFDPLPKRNVDFGGGLERLTAATNNDPDVFQIDVLQNLISKLEASADKSYADATREYRIIIDHLRAAVFLIDDGVIPTNSDQGYFVRRLLRRAVRSMDTIDNTQGFGYPVTELIDSYKHQYPSLASNKEMIISNIELEEKKFRKTLTNGLKEFEKSSDKEIDADTAFKLFSTYGFPIELTVELAQEKNIEVDVDGFIEMLKDHQDLSRAGAEKKFKGGLAGTGEKELQYHTATHLLNAALREVLGDHVEQKGSNITPDRLRFDFSHGAKMTDAEKSKVEEFVNKMISDALPVSHKDMPIEEAKVLGAIGVFGDKYDDVVKVYTVGDEADPVSRELCGGPHVTNTSELNGVFKIKKEEAVAAGIRRIKAILE